MPDTDTPTPPPATKAPHAVTLELLFTPTASATLAFASVVVAFQRDLAYLINSDPTLTGLATYINPDSHIIAVSLDVARSITYLDAQLIVLELVGTVVHDLDVLNSASWSVRFHRIRTTLSR